MKAPARLYREFLGYDPRPDLAAIRVPVLALTGDKDRQVDPGDLDVIARLVPGPVETRRVPELTHILRRDPWPRLPADLSPAVPPPGRPGAAGGRGEVGFCAPPGPRTIRAGTWLTLRITEGVTHARGSSRPQHVLREDAVIGVQGLLYAEAGSLHHGLEKPVERRVLVSDVLLELRAAPALVSVRARAGDPGVEMLGRSGGIEAVDHVPQTEHPTLPKRAAESGQSDRLPEVGQVMERIAGVDEVCEASAVLVAQEPGLRDLNIGQPRCGHLRSQDVEHHGRHIHRNHPGADGGGGNRELARPGAEVDDGRLGSKTQFLAEADLARFWVCAPPLPWAETLRPKHLSDRTVRSLRTVTASSRRPP